MNACGHIPVRDRTMAYSVSSKWRTLIREKSIDESLRRTILDSIIAYGGDPASGFSVVALWTPIKWLTPKCEQQTEPLKSARRKECEHVRSSFGFDKQSHVTEIVDVWSHSQLARLSLNSQSTCFGSTPSIKFAGTHMYTSVDGESYCENKMSYPRARHSEPGQGSNPDRSIQRRTH